MDTTAYDGDLHARSRRATSRSLLLSQKPSVLRRMPRRQRRGSRSCSSISLPSCRQHRPIGVFRTRTVTTGGQRVVDAMTPLHADLLVSADTPYSDLVQIAREQPFVFVVQGHEIDGFITPNDLGSAPARTHYYLLLAGLEMALAQLIRARYPDQRGAVEALGVGARQRHSKLVAELRKEDAFLDDVAAMSLMDLVNLASKDREFRDRASEGGRGWGWLTSGLVAFRDDVMHPVRDFTKATEDGLAKLSEFDERLSTLMEAAESAMKIRATEAT